ncbi:hypothetical protein [Enterococcus sp. CSURQ0835]|uniref:hypothetical protein n=1 Tax=Enterococcus sp. CSURQ0835 TaxID=2681394 RepID=UPI00135CC42A|nr:hypothetical protein [Enterococcus sp. CSURQ0835]
MTDSLRDESAEVGAKEVISFGAKLLLEEDVGWKGVAFINGEGTVETVFSFGGEKMLETVELGKIILA